MTILVLTHPHGSFRVKKHLDPPFRDAKNESLGEMPPAQAGFSSKAVRSQVSSASQTSWLAVAEGTQTNEALGFFYKAFKHIKKSAKLESLKRKDSSLASFFDSHKKPYPFNLDWKGS